MYIFLAIILIIATITDIRFRKIPNWITYPTMAAGIVCHTCLNGLEGCLYSVSGVLLGHALLIFFYLCGGMGAGDVKLMGGIGGFLGPKGVLIAFIGTAFVGLIYAVILLIIHGHIKETVIRYVTILKVYLFTKNFIYIPPVQRGKMPVLCYGVAIACGTLISMLKGIIYI